MLGSKGFIPLMTPAQAFKSIQVMTEHSHNWYDEVKADQLTRMVLTNAGERVKAKTKIGKKDMKESVPCYLLVVQPYVPPTPFPGRLKKQKDDPKKTRETVCMIRIPEKIHKKRAREDEGDMNDG
ncbi:hypothetical protein Tco_0438331 [Tanacetum coccineum]